MNGLAGRAALVVGGSAGIGRGAAEALVARGARVIVADINEERGTVTAEKLTADGPGTATFVHVDVMSEDSIVAGCRQAAETLGGLDIVVNSAGRIYRNEPEAWQRNIEMFLRAPYLVCRETIPVLERAGKGSIVNIASMAGITGTVRENIEDTSYDLAKHGVVGLTRDLGLTLAPKNIRVNAISPGYIRTELTRALWEDQPRSEHVINEDLRVPMRRWGEAIEIGNVVAFLASDDSSYITGQIIPVDGGLMAR